MKRYRKWALFVGAITSLAAGTLFVFSLDGIQKKIAVEILEKQGITAEFGEWDSCWFSEWNFRDVVLTTRDVELRVPDLRLEANLFSLVFTSDLSLKASSEKNAELCVRGKNFECFLEHFSLSNLPGQRNCLRGWFATAETNSTKRIELAFESENRSAIRDFSVAAWIAGTRRAEAQLGEIEFSLNETGAWKIADNVLSGTCSGAGTLEVERFDGNLHIHFDGEKIKSLGLMKNFPPLDGEFRIEFSGSPKSGEIQVRHAFDVFVKNAAGTFAGFSLFPELNLRGKGELEFSEISLVAKTFFAEIYAVSGGENVTAFAEVSLPGKLTFLRGDNGNLEILADDGAEELARLDFNKIPLALANPFLAKQSAGNAGSALSLSGTLDGTLTLKKNNGAFIFSGEKPIEIENFKLSAGGDVILEKLAASIPLTLFFRNNCLGVRVDSAEILGEKNDSIGNVHFTGKRDFSTAKTGVDFSVRLESVALEQNIFKKYFVGLTEREIELESALKAEISEDTFAVSEFAFAIVNAKKDVLLSAKTEAFSCNVKNPFAGLRGKKIALRASAFPLALVNPLARGKFYFSGTLDGKLNFVGSNDGIEFSTTGKSTAIREFYMRDAQNFPLLTNLSLRSDKNILRISQQDDGCFRTQIDIRNGVLRNGRAVEIASGDLFLDFSGSKLLVLKSRLGGNFQRLFEQPLLSASGNFASGTFELNGVLDGYDCRSKFNLACRNLRSRDDAWHKVESLDFAFEQGDFQNSDDVARAVFDMRGAERSRVLLRFSRLDFDWRTGVTQFSAKANASKLELLDFWALSKIFECSRFSASEVAVSESPKIVVSDVSVEKPTSLSKEVTGSSESSVGSVQKMLLTPQFFSEEKKSVAEKKIVPKRLVRVPWKNFFGDLEFRINELSVPENTLRGFSGVLVLAPKHCDFSAETSEFFGGELTFKSTVEVQDVGTSFSANANLAVRDARLNEAIPILREKNPPMLEGKFDLDLRANSQADRFEDLIESLSAQTKIIGRDGHIRVFASDNKQMQSVNGLAQLGGDMIGLLGSFAGKLSPRAESIGNAVQDLQKYLSDFPFDVHEIHLNYSVGQPILCDKFLLQNDVLRISGTGKIDYVPEIEIGNAPLSANARLDARGDLEKLLRVVNVLKSGRNKAENAEDGYVRGPEFKFSGTLNHISDNLLETLLTSGIGVEF